MRSAKLLCAPCAFSLILSGCGTSLPSLEPSDPVGAQKTPALVTSVASRINCELSNTINSITARPGYDWLRTWSALITLTMTVEEKSIASPGVTLTHFYPGFIRNFANGTSSKTDQTFSLGLGAGVTADATHVVKVEWLVDFASYQKQPDANKFLSACGADPDHLIGGELGIYEAVNSGTQIALLPGEDFNGFRSGGPLQVISDDITFDLTYTGSANPSWKFADVSNNTSGNLFSATRDRKDDVIIAMGPTVIEDTKRVLVGDNKSKIVKGSRADQASLARKQPSTAIFLSTLASQIQQALPTRIQP